MRVGKLDPTHSKWISEQVQVSPQLMGAVEQALKNSRRVSVDPQTIRSVEQTTRNLFRPALEEYIRDALRVQERVRETLEWQQYSSTPQFRLPPSALRPSITINENAVRAAVNAAKSAYSVQLKGATEQFANSVPINLAPAALASAQFTSLRRLLKAPLEEATRAVLQGTQANVQGLYTESLRRTAELLSNVDVRRMIELAESAELIEEAIETSRETGASLEEVVSEDIKLLSFNPSDAADALLPYVSWAIMILSVVLIMSYSNDSFAQYKEPTTVALASLAILERALKKSKEGKED